MDPLDRPAFLIGCGRSGTTILGQTLAQHASLHYLNEPRELWSKAYPVTDVWSGQAATRRGRVVLDAADASRWRTWWLGRLFRRTLRDAGCPRLLEKLPINAFRVPFLDTLFPDARFIHLVRNGIEVARSIERECERGPWYGENDYKWTQLTALASADASHGALLELCTGPYERGLLEWRLSVDAVLETAAHLPSDRYLLVRYEDLLNAPAHTIARIETFLGLPADPAVTAFAEERIARRSAEAETLPTTTLTDDIAGPMLERLGYVRPLPPAP